MQANFDVLPGFKQKTAFAGLKQKTAGIIKQHWQVSNRKQQESS